MLVFSTETSCDETSVCIMKEDKTILSHIVYSQKVHTKHGGVVPELASRAHLEILQQITKEALKESIHLKKTTRKEIAEYAIKCKMMNIMMPYMESI